MCGNCYEFAGVESGTTFILENTQLHYLTRSKNTLFAIEFFSLISLRAEQLSSLASRWHGDERDCSPLPRVRTLSQSGKKMGIYAQTRSIMESFVRHHPSVLVTSTGFYTRP